MYERYAIYADGQLMAIKYTWDEAKQERYTLWYVLGRGEVRIVPLAEGENPKNQLHGSY